jgi:hypothetical protein
MAQGGLHNNLGGNLLCSLMDLTQSDFLSPGTDMEGQLMLKAYRAMKKLRYSMIRRSEEGVSVGNL